MRLQDNSKCYIYTLQESQKEHREKGPEKMSEYIIAKNSLTWERKYSLKSKKAQRVLHRIKPKRNMLRHILIKPTKIKNKENILKTTREKQEITYKGFPIRLSTDFSAENLQPRSEWHNVFKVIKQENLEQRII